MTADPAPTAVPTTSPVICEVVLVYGNAQRPAGSHEGASTIVGGAETSNSTEIWPGCCLSDAAGATIDGASAVRGVEASGDGSQAPSASAPMSPRLRRRFLLRVDDMAVLRGPMAPACGRSARCGVAVEHRWSPR